MSNSSYSKQNPFFAALKERYLLSKPGSHKRTHHLVLDLRGSDLTYEVGDSIGIFPEHDLVLVIKTLRAMKLEGTELVRSKQALEGISFSQLLTSRANITDISPKLLREVYTRQSNNAKKSQLEELLKEENREKLKLYLSEHEIWDFLLAHEEVTFKPQELADLLMPMLPRFYSIASSQKHVGDEVHLTVAPLEYESRGHQRRGVCTHYLCQLVDLNDSCIPIFIQPSHGFHLPEDPHSSLIMIGPGTGVAPFRAFMQERLLYEQSKGKHWLFFGEWNRAYDFFYEEDWQGFSVKGHLRLDLAFSRDQDHKIYVQHRMQEHGHELYEWLEKGAYIYVCGDAQYMAKDVEATLLDIIQKHGFKETGEAKNYLKNLRQQKRYLRDVY